MLHKMFTFFLCLCLTTPSLIFANGEEGGENFAVNEEMVLYNEDCAEGECVTQLIEQFQNVERLAREQGCLPPDGATDEEVYAHFEEVLLDESCIGHLRELKRIEDHLIVIESELVGHAQGSEVRCEPIGDGTESLLSEELIAATGSGEELQCTEEKKEQNRQQCWDDAKCALYANSIGGITALFRGLGLSEREANSEGQGCDAVDDNCMVQLANGFKTAVVAFFEGTWDLLKMAGRGIRNGVVSGWRSLWGVEDASSTNALALAEASEDEGIFRQIMSDPLGAVGNMWEALMGMLKHWMANDVFCQRWEGQAHNSECLEPAAGWDCLTCKSIINGSCNLVGVALSEVVPAFLTGGLVSAVRHGGRAASTLARTIRLSDETRNAIKSSRLARLTSETASRAVNATRAPRLIGQSAEVLGQTLSRIRGFMISPLRSGVSKSLTAVKSLGSRLGTYKVVQGGKTLVGFGTKGLSKLGKVLIYPIENPLTKWAFNLGDSLGPARVVSPLRGFDDLPAESMARMEEADPTFTRLSMSQEELDEVSGLAGTMTRDGRVIIPDSSITEEIVEEIQETSQELLTRLRQNREEVTGHALNLPKIEVSQIIDELYPELKYSSDMARNLPGHEVLEAEGQLRAAIGRVSDPTVRNRLSFEFDSLRASQSRNSLNLAGGRYFSASEVLYNSQLNQSDRLRRALEISKIRRANLEPDELEKLKEVIERAHSVGEGRGAGVYHYTPEEIVRKYRILREGGFDTLQSRELLRSGIAGRVPDGVAFSHLDDALITNLVRSSWGRTDGSDYVKFLRNNRKTLDEMMQKGHMFPALLDPDNYTSIRAIDSGTEFSIIKNGDFVAHVFKTNGERFSTFSLSKTKQLDHAFKPGQIFERTDGSLAMFFDTTRGSRSLRDISVRPLSRKSDLERFANDMLREFPVNDPRLADEYREFLTTHQDRLIKLFKKGVLAPDEINPQILATASHPGNGQRYQVFFGEDGDVGKTWVFSNKGRESGIEQGGQRFRDITERNKSFNLTFDDDIHIRRGARGEGVSGYVQTNHLLTKKVLESSNFFENLQKSARANLSAEDFSIYDDFLQRNRRNMEEALGAQKLTPMDIAPHNMQRFRGADGNEYLTFLKPDLSRSPVFRVDGGQINNRSFSFLTDRPRIFGDNITFANGDKVRTWQVGDNRRRVFEKSYEAPLRNLRSDIHRRFGVSGNNGQIKFENFLSFFDRNEAEIRRLIREGKIQPDELLPSQHYVIRSDQGDTFDVLLPRGRSENMIILPKSINDEIQSASEVLSPSGLRRFGNEFRGQDNFHLTFDEGDFSLSFNSRSRTRSEFYRADDVIDNSYLTLNEKVREFEGQFSRTLKRAEKDALAQALTVGQERRAGAFSYTSSEIREVENILLGGGFSSFETNHLIRSGLAARPPTRLAEASGSYFSPSFSSLSRRGMQVEIDKFGDSLVGRTRRVGNREVQYSQEEIKRIKENLNALYFVDHRHTLPELAKLLKGESRLEDLDLLRLYNKGDNAGENYLTVHRWLEAERPDISEESLGVIQAGFMKGGVESSVENQIGLYRSEEILGHINTKSTYNRTITQHQIDRLKANPYTDFEIHKINADGTYEGDIIYPYISSVKDEALERIALAEPELVENIRFYRGIGQRQREITEKMKGVNTRVRELEARSNQLSEELQELRKVANTDDAVNSQMRAIEQELQEIAERLPNIRNEVRDEVALLTRELNRNNKKMQELGRLPLQSNMVRAMTKERIKWFNERRAEIGSINSPEKLDEFTNLLATFQRDLVSIHPFSNGNGRVSREFAIYLPLMKEGYPIPRLRDIDNDILESTDFWQREIKDGIVASQALIDDLRFRGEAGIPLDDSIELLRPMGVEEVRRPMFRKGDNPWSEGPEVTAVDRGQFNQYVREVVEEKPELLSVAERNPNQGWETIHNLARERYKRNNIYYDYRGKGKHRIEELRLGVIEEEFRETFGRASYDRPDVYRTKMERWYEDEVNWRGLATQYESQVRSEEQILNIFKEIDPHMVSNSALQKINRQRTTGGPDVDLRTLALQDFDEYSRALKSDELAKLADMHQHEKAPYFDRSMGYSTSGHEHIGEAFAMGAMQVGEWRKLPGEDIADFMKPENQARVFQRLNIGAQRSIKDIDLMRLKPLRNEFQAGYMRQKEVIGVGAADPDSISIIKELNENREVIRSYVRNPERPYEIWIVDGNAKPGERPPEGTFRTVDLRGPRSPAQN